MMGFKQVWGGIVKMEPEEESLADWKRKREIGDYAISIALVTLADSLVLEEGDPKEIRRRKRRWNAGFKFNSITRLGALAEMERARGECSDKELAKARERITKGWGKPPKIDGVTVVPGNERWEFRGKHFGKGENGIYVVTEVTEVTEVGEPPKPKRAKSKNTRGKRPRTARKKRG